MMIRMTLAGQLRDAQICVEGSTDAGVVTRSCAVPGGGEAHLDLPRGSALDLAATMEGVTRRARRRVDDPRLHNYGRHAPHL